MKTVKNGKLKNVLNTIIVKLVLYGSAPNGSRKATENAQNQSLDENSVNVLTFTFFVLEGLRINIYTIGILCSKLYIVCKCIVYCAKRTGLIKDGYYKNSLQRQR